MSGFGTLALVSADDRREKPAPEKIGQLASIDPIVLASRVEQGILAWITHHNFRDVRLKQVVQPRRAGSFLKGDVQTAGQPVKKLQKGCRFRLENGLHQEVAGRIQNHCRNRCLMNIQTNLLSGIHGRVLPFEGVDARDQNLL
jgi:hypothetical protein